MQDYQNQLAKLRRGATECRLVRDLATDRPKRELFDRLAIHLSVLADQVELAVLEERSRRPRSRQISCSRSRPATANDRKRQ